MPQGLLGELLIGLAIIVRSRLIDELQAILAVLCAGSKYVLIVDIFRLWVGIPHHLFLVALDRSQEVFRVKQVHALPL